MDIARFIPSERTIKKVYLGNMLMLFGIPHSFFQKFVLCGLLETHLHKYVNGPFFVISRPDSKNIEAFVRILLANVVVTGISFGFEGVRLPYLYACSLFLGLLELSNIGIELFVGPPSSKTRALYRQKCMADLANFGLQLIICLYIIFVYFSPSYIKNCHLNTECEIVSFRLMCEALLLLGIVEWVSIKCQKGISFATSWPDSENMKTLIRAVVSLQLLMLSGFFSCVRPYLKKAILISVTANVMVLDLFSYTQKIDMIISSFLGKRSRIKRLFFDSIDFGRSENMKDLIRYIADENVTNEYGEIPLYLASCSGNVKVIKLLAERGVNVNATNRDGLTTLCAYLIQVRSSIVRGEPWAIKPIKLLIAYGADVHATYLNQNIFDNHTKTLFHYVVIDRMNVKPEGLSSVSKVIREIMIAIFLEDSNEDNPNYKWALEKQKEVMLPNLNLSVFWKGCQSEFEELRKRAFYTQSYEKISLADIARVTDQDELVRLSYRKDLMETALDPTFKKAYPIFGLIIRAKLKRAFVRAKYIENAAKQLYHVIEKNRLPIEMYKKIAFDLAIADLENLESL